MGTILGAMFAGIPGDRLGRRDSLRIMAVLYVVSAVGCAFAWDWYSLVFFRFVGGLGIGGSSVLGPMYIAEVSPAKWRGRLVGFFQFNVVSGILLAYLSNYLLGTAGLGSAEWRWKLGVSALPAVLFFAMLFGIPRSPRWLVQKRRDPEAPLGRSTWTRSCGISSPPSMPNTAAARSRCSPTSTVCLSFWRSPSPCSTSFPASTPSFTT
jgi:MFS family permease